jgi:hypothetical protein
MQRSLAQTCVSEPAGSGADQGIISCMVAPHGPAADVKQTAAMADSLSSCSSSSDDEFGFRPETDSDEERAAAMAGPAALTLETLQERQREQSRARAAGAQKLPHPQRRLLEGRPPPRTVCAHCGVRCRPCRRSPSAQLARAAASGSTVLIGEHFGAIRLSGQRLAFAKLMHSRLAGLLGPNSLPYPLYESVCITAGCEQTQRRVQSDCRVSLSLASCGMGASEAATTRQCMVAAIRAEQVRMCRLLLRQSGVACMVEPFELNLPGAGQPGNKPTVTTLLDLVARSPSASAIPMLADMWECAPPHCPWGAATWRRTLLRVHDRCTQQPVGLRESLIAQHQAIGTALETRFPAAEATRAAHAGQICGAADVHTQDDDSWAAAGPRAELAWAHLPASHRAPTTQALLTELHPAVLVSQNGRSQLIKTSRSTDKN